MKGLYNIEMRSLFNDGDTVLIPGDSTIYSVVNSKPQSRNRITIEDKHTSETKRVSQYSVRKARHSDLKIIHKFNRLMEEIV